MSIRLPGLFAGLLLLVLAAAFAPPAAVAAPSAVTVRVEGKTQTLVPRVGVTTTTTPVVKDGNPAHSCTGTSAAGALELATVGAWGGTWFDGLGYAVENVKGESHAFPDPDFFTFWLNNRESAVGVCGAELQAGDEVLIFVARCESAPAPVYCSNPPVLPLGLTAPKKATIGAPFNVTVVEHATNGTPTPVAGATVNGGAAPATTGADGVASVTLAQGGDAMLRATKANRAPSASEAVCATNGSDGLCGTTVPVTVATPCVHDGDDGRCGTPDRKHAFSFIRGIAEQQRFRAGGAPRTLRGDVSTDPSGLASVKLRLTRAGGGRGCAYFSGRSERFRPMRCGAKNGSYFRLGDRAGWSYLLPGALGRGRYVLDVVAIDKAGNREPLARGRNRVVFHVG